MPEIALEPYRKVVIRSCMPYASPDAFLQTTTSALPAGRYAGLLWANGVLFRHLPLPATDTVTRELVQGNLFIDLLEFAPMPEYRSELSVKERGIVMSVADVSSYELFNAITRWLNTKFIHRALRHKRKRE